MSCSWTDTKTNIKYWIKTGKNYIELHRDKHGLQNKVRNLTSDQVKQYEQNPSSLLKRV